MRRIAPAVILPGTADGGGHPQRAAPQRHLQRHRAAPGRGPPAQPARRDGPPRHPVETLGLDTDVTSIRSPSRGSGARFPPSQPGVSCAARFQSRGTLARPDGGRLAGWPDRHGRCPGSVTVQPPQWGAEDLLLRFSRLDLAALTGRRLPTTLDWRASVHRQHRHPAGARGRAGAGAHPKPDSGMELDSVFARGIHDSVIRVDTAYAGWKGARRAVRMPGLGAPHTGAWPSRW